MSPDRCLFSALLLAVLSLAFLLLAGRGILGCHWWAGRRNDFAGSNAVLNIGDVFIIVAKHDAHKRNKT